MIIPKEEVKQRSIAKLVEEHKVDYFDFGCSNGGSLELVKRSFKDESKGMGFDISQAKLDTASSRDHLVSNFDILDLPDERVVNFTTMFHILEHLDSLRLVKRFLHKACSVSKKFVFLKQPFFDADSNLFAHGLKMYWSDWSGHPNRMTSLEMYLTLMDFYQKKEIAGFKIYGKMRIPDSSCSQVLPLTAPEDQHDYDPDVHPPKRTDLIFDFPVFYELAALIEIEKGSGEKFVGPYKADEVIFSTDA